MSFLDPVIITVENNYIIWLYIIWLIIFRVELRIRMLSLWSCKVGHLAIRISDDNNELMMSLTFLLQGWFIICNELLYVGSFQSDFDGKHSLIPATQTACSLILSFNSFEQVCKSRFKNIHCFTTYIRT